MCGPASAQPNTMIVYGFPVCSKYDARTTCSKYKGGEDILFFFSKIRSKYFCIAINTLGPKLYTYLRMAPHTILSAVESNCQQTINKLTPVDF